MHLQAYLKLDWRYVSLEFLCKGLESEPKLTPFIFQIPDGLSRYTTVKLLLEEIEDNLRNAPSAGSMDNFLHALRECRSGSKTFTLVIEDCLGLSMMQPPDHRVSQLKVVKSVRKASDDIYFGLDRESVLAETGCSKLETLERLLRVSEKVVILSGAGISTESGIPAFRSPDGMDNLWDKYDPSLATLSAIETEERARVEYWSMHSELWDLVAARSAAPNASHDFAVKLDQLKRLKMVITQNIDGLYQSAGLSPSKLIEIHGTITKAKCSKCRIESDREEAHQRWKNGEKVPDCKACGAPLRFSTIAFQEPIPAESIEGSKEVIKDCDLLIIMGTSLVVQPANKLPEIALDAGVPVALLNLGPTPLDNVVDLLIPGKCGENAKYLLDRLAEIPSTQDVMERRALFKDPVVDESPQTIAPSSLVSTRVYPGIEPREIALASFLYIMRRK